MFLKTLQSDARYSKYIFKRFFPYTLIMTCTLLAINILVYSIGNYYRVGEALYLIDISIPTQIFMYIMPVILGCAQFRFLFARSGADFLGAMPTTRAQLFNSNIISGLASIFIMVGVNAVYLAISMPLVHPDTMIAPSMYLWYFFYWFIAYAVMFAVTAFAATLSGTILAQLILTFVTIITPGFFITAFQLVCGSNIDASMMTNGVITTETADIFIQILFAPYYPVQQMFYLTFSYDRFTGMYYDIQTFPMLICNIIMLFVFIYAGSRLLRRRKFELAGGAYSSEKLYGAIKILAVFPFIFIMLRILAEETEFWIFMLFMIMITVFYILMDICLRKGLAKVKISILTYLISFGFSAVVFFGFYAFDALVFGKNIYVPQAEITSVTVYMEPMGLSYSDSYAPITKACIPVKLDDAELIAAFKDSADREEKSNAGTNMIMRINVNGRSLYGRYYVNGSFMERLYEIIESDEELKEKLDYTEKRKQSNRMVCISTSGTSYIGSYYRGGYNGFKVSNRQAQEGLLAMLDAKNENRSVTERYNNTGITVSTSSSTSSIIAKDENYYYVTDSKQSTTSHVISYINGVYYTESFAPATAQEFEEFCTYMNMNAADFTKGKNDKLTVYFNTEISTSLNSDFLGSSSIFTSVCKIYGDEIVAAVKENAYTPKAEDTVMVHVCDSLGRFVYAAISYKDTVKPLIERYLADSLTFAENFDYSAAPELTVKIYPDGINDTAIYVTSYFSANSLRDTFEKITNLCTVDKALYTSAGHLPDAINGRAVVEVSIDSGYYSIYTFYAYMNEELEEFFTDSNSKLYCTTYVDRLELIQNEILSLYMDGHMITDPLTVEYFRPYIVTMITSGTYGYMDVDGVNCTIIFKSSTDTSGKKEYSTYLPLSKEMYQAYKMAINVAEVK